MLVLRSLVDSWCRLKVIENFSSLATAKLLSFPSLYHTSESSTPSSISVFNLEAFVLESTLKISNVCFSVTFERQIFSSLEEHSANIVGLSSPISVFVRFNSFIELSSLDNLSIRLERYREEMLQFISSSFFRCSSELANTSDGIPDKNILDTDKLFILLPSVIFIN